MITSDITFLTMILSSQVLSSPKCCRMDLTCSSASLSLEGDRVTQTKYHSQFGEEVYANHRQGN